jgi:hypothetical protein
MKPPQQRTRFLVLQGLGCGVWRGLESIHQWPVDVINGKAEWTEAVPPVDDVVTGWITVC